MQAKARIYYLVLHFPTNFSSLGGNQNSERINDLPNVTQQGRKELTFKNTIEPFNH